MNELEKMDALKQRMDISYAQAKEALDACGGDVAKALVYLEGQGFSYVEYQGVEDDASEPIWDMEKAENFVRGIVEQVKAFVKEGSVTKVRLVSDGKTMIEIPATVGVVGVGVMLFSPLLAILTAVGAATALVKEMVFEVEKADGTVEKHELRLPSFSFSVSCCEDEDCDCEDCRAEAGADADTPAEAEDASLAEDAEEAAADDE